MLQIALCEPSVRLMTKLAWVSEIAPDRRLSTNNVNSSRWTNKGKTKMPILDDSENP